MKAPPKIVVIAVVLVTIIAVSSFLYVYVFSPKKVRIGYLQGDLHQLAFFVAVEKGFFKAEGIDFDYFVFPNGVSEMDGFASNAINVGYLGVAPATFKSIRAHINITVVASANAEGSAIIAASGSGINSVDQLVGKRVAIPNTATVQDVLLRLALSQHGLSYGNLSGGYPIAPVSPATMPGLLGEGEGKFDAYIAWEPYNALSVVNGNGKEVVNSSQIWSNHPCCVLSIRQDFLSENLDLVKKIVRAHISATRYILENHADVIEIAKKWTGQNETVITRAMSNIKFMYQPNPDGVTEWINYLIQFGLLQESEIQGGITQFVAKFVNTTIVQEVE